MKISFYYDIFLLFYEVKFERIHLLLLVGYIFIKCAHTPTCKLHYMPEWNLKSLKPFLKDWLKLVKQVLMILFPKYGLSHTYVLESLRNTILNTYTYKITRIKGNFFYLFLAIFLK